MNRIIQGDSTTVLKQLLDESVQTCVTSPPYFGLRDYGAEGQMGLEETPEEYVAAMVRLFREVRRVLRADGTLWLNLGDSYGKGKQLLGIPWRTALALQADGWTLRQDIIWAKPNPMPESVTDRCARAHEYVFLFSKGPRYYFDSEAIKEPVAEGTAARYAYGFGSPEKKKTIVKSGHWHTGKNGRDNLSGNMVFKPTRNRRSVWTVTAKPYKGAHFATFPPALIEPCILAGASKGGVVLDPFFGSGTTGAAAVKHGRQYIGIELNPEYIKLAEQRLAGVQIPLAA